MTVTYDPTLGDNISQVRELVPDRNTLMPIFSDEEIAAVISRQTAVSLSSRLYYAAAELLRTAHLEMMTAGRGKTSKKVAQLQVVYGSGSGINVDLAIQAHITDLRKEAARREAKGNSRSFTFRTSRGF